MTIHCVHASGFYARKNEFHRVSNQRSILLVMQIEHSKTKSQCVGMFSDRGRVCVFVIDGKDHNQQHNDDRMGRSEAKLHFRYQKLKHVFR
jgi:hypothetical protein